jgi:hypothetical protein
MMTLAAPRKPDWKPEPRDDDEATGDHHHDSNVAIIPPCERRVSSAMVSVFCLHPLCQRATFPGSLSSHAIFARSLCLDQAAVDLRNPQKVGHLEKQSAYFVRLAILDPYSSPFIRYFGFSLLYFCAVCLSLTQAAT